MNETGRNDERNPGTSTVKYKRIWGDRKAFIGWPIAIVAIILIITLALVAVYVWGQTNDDYGYTPPNTPKEDCYGYIDVKVDLRGAKPIGDDSYFKIENKAGTSPIHATFSMGTTSLTFLEAFERLGIFSTKVSLKLDIIISSSAGMEDYDAKDETKFSWTIDEGALTVYKSKVNSEPFFVDEEGLYHITVNFYKWDDDDWRLQDTATSTIKVVFT
ncbi:MAG: hypothetical protein LUQ09_07675 [Methanomassiliicoccales archaeon]|nr:hypothetical protein [Methanomassiliicoccales archaeon]